MFRASQLFLRPISRASRAALLPTLPRAPSLARYPLQPVTVQLIRLTSSSNRPPSGQSIDTEHQKKVAQEKLESRPEEVTTTSSVRQVLESNTARTDDEVDIGKSLRHDIDVVKDTFRLDTVPRESHILGLSGTVPYLITSMSTVFLAWDLTRELPTGNAFYDAIFVNHDTARYLLDVIEPLQLGYGAVIISFLGAIHWGLEYAEKQPQHDRTRFRYGMGLAASIVAWPTLLMPIEYALTAQFGAFLALYYADSRATTRGWAPPWYAKYRFLLTAMVGLAIFISLVGRAKIGQKGALNKRSLHSKMTEPGIADKNTNWTKLEAEEKEKIRKEKEAEKAKKETSAKKGENKPKGSDSQTKENKNDSKGKGEDAKKGKDENKEENTDENKGKNDGQAQNKDNTRTEDKDKADQDKKQDGNDSDKN